MPWTVADIPDQAGKVAIVTGTGGLGYETALALARAGARVVIAGRNAEKGADAVRNISEVSTGAVIGFEVLDLASLASIRRFADRMRERIPSIDILVNNAGVMSPPKRRETEDGFELQFGVNYLGHFALTLLLLPQLVRGGQGRVVNVTSLAQHSGKIAFDDLQSSRRYRPGKSYCQSKLAQAIFARELQRRCDARGEDLLITAAHPGLAATSLFENGSGPGSMLAWVSKYVAGPLVGQSAARGALPLLYAATSPDARKGALYGPTGLFGMKGPPGPATFAQQALYPAIAERLWQRSEALTGVTF